MQEIRINTELIRELIRDRKCSWLKNHEDLEMDLAEFLDLDKISYRDKIWVSMQVLSKKQVLQCAHDFAFRVLHIFEGKYPEDKSIRDLLGALQRYIDHDIEISDEVRNEARASESKVWDDSATLANALALAAAAAYEAANALVAADAAANAYVAALAAANVAAYAAAAALAAANVAAYDAAAAYEAANAYADAYDAANANEQANQIEIIKNIYQKRN